jgi:hypothetical protein
MNSGLLVTGTLLVLLISTGLTAGSKKVDPRVREIKTIYITGTGTAVIKARDRLEEKTCYKLAPSKEKADAVLTLQQDVFHQRGMGTVTGELADAKSGDLLWSSSQKATTMFADVGDPADKAMKRILDELNKVGCK